MAQSGICDLSPVQLDPAESTYWDTRTQREKPCCQLEALIIVASNKDSQASSRNRVWMKRDDT